MVNLSLPPRYDPHPPVKPLLPVKRVANVPRSTVYQAKEPDPHKKLALVNLSSSCETSKRQNFATSCETCTWNLEMRFLGKIGSISEISRICEELTVEWQIRNFFTLSGKRGDYYESPGFGFGGALWYLVIYSNGETRNPPSGCVDIYLEREDSGPARTIEFTISIQGASGVEKRSRMEQFVYSSRDCSYGFSDFLSRQVLRDHQSILMPDNLLTIRCSMESLVPRTAAVPPSQTDGGIRNSSFRTGGDQSSNKQEASVQTEFRLAEALAEENYPADKQGIEKLSVDLSQLLVKDDLSDVIFEVGDVTFRAHRAILSARCPPLGAMIRHDSAERTSGKITVGDCEPDVFRVFLRHLYTGSAGPFSARTVFGLYRVADEYLVDDLKSGCLGHIRGTLSVRTFCDTVRLALTHGESDLLQLCLDFARENVQPILVTTEWQDFNCECPREANEILIKSICPRS